MGLQHSPVCADPQAARHLFLPQSMRKMRAMWIFSISKLNPLMNLHKWQHLAALYISKLSKCSLTFVSWNPCWIHIHSDLNPFQVFRKMLKNFTIASYTLPSPPPQKWMKHKEKKQMEKFVGMAECLHLQTEMAKLSELKLPYKVSLPSRKVIRKAFWPKFSFISPLGSSDSFFLLFTTSFGFSVFPSNFKYVGTFNFVIHVGQSLLLGIILVVRWMLHYQKQTILWTVLT